MAAPRALPRRPQERQGVRPRRRPPPFFATERFKLSNQPAKGHDRAWRLLAMDNADKVGVWTFLMFEQKAEEAMRFYVSLFPGSKVLSTEHYGKGENGPEGAVKTAWFSLKNQRFMCIDSPVKHQFGFTPSTSIFVHCESEEELDHAYGQLVQGGTELMPLGDYGFSKKFGWLNDRYGVSWQLSFPG
jgi:predicted 3-demethylubiquinone-9 3-methyltransferase (glyoxalase superfamily)